jgi:hypothetical protein
LYQRINYEETSGKEGKENEKQRKSKVKMKDRS